MSAVIGQDADPVLKALAAAAAGRSLLMLYARQRRPVSWGLVGLLLVYEIPVVCAFALLGWHAGTLLGLDGDSERIVGTVLLAHFGKPALDLLLARVLGPRVPGFAAPDDPTPPPPPSSNPRG